MSFLKDLFQKSKDKKYGKGHRLGDANRPATPAAASSTPPRSSDYVPAQQPKSEAAIRAGEAALQRLQSAKNPRPAASTTTAATARQLSSQLRQDTESVSKELDKALKLKEHYFGQKRLVTETGLINKNRIYFTASILPENEKHPAGEIEDRIEQLLIEKLHEEPILVACTLLCTANYKDADKLTKCVEILNKFADNILNNPNEEKYRKIRVENQTFKEKVYSCKYADLVLKHSGFKPKSIPKDSDVVLISAEGKPIENAAAMEDYFVFEGDSFDTLTSLKTFLSLAEPIKPELDRDVRVYKVGSGSTSQIGEFELSDDFYNLKIEELRREQQLRNEALEKSGMLRTKAMRERDEHLESRRYNYCLIRVRFPNGLVLQAVFKSTEKYQNLCEFVNECLEIGDVPFDFVSHSLRRAPNMADSTLAECGLAPAALLNFKIADDVDEAVKSSFSRYVCADLLDKIQEF
jgi:UBX domain-containing protein 6